MPCPFANILGTPNTGIHSIRVLDIALVDLILTIIGAFIIAKSYNINVIVAFFGLFILGEILHYMFGVNTAFLKKINMSPTCS